MDRRVNSWAIHESGLNFNTLPGNTRTRHRIGQPRCWTLNRTGRYLLVSPKEQHSWWPSYPQTRSNYAVKKQDNLYVKCCIVETDLNEGDNAHEWKDASVELFDQALFLWRLHRVDNVGVIVNEIYARISVFRWMTVGPMWRQHLLIIAIFVCSSSMHHMYNLKLK